MKGNSKSYELVLNWMAKSVSGLIDLFVKVNSIKIFPDFLEKVPSICNPFPRVASSQTCLGGTYPPAEIPKDPSPESIEIIKLHFK